MRKYIKYYIDLMKKYFLVKVGTILLILMILTKILTLISETIYKQRDYNFYFNSINVSNQIDNKVNVENSIK